MSQEQNASGESTVICVQCDLPLEMGKIEVGYLGSKFPVDLLHCPKCGQTYIPEDLALGKMAEVEKILEDK